MKCCRNMLSLTIPSVPQPAILITVTDILHITAVWPLAPPTWWTWGRWRLALESGRFKSAKGSTTHGRFGSKKEFGTSRLTSFSVMQEYSFLVVLVTILFMNTMLKDETKQTQISVGYSAVSFIFSIDFQIKFIREPFTGLATPTTEGGPMATRGFGLPL